MTKIKGHGQKTQVVEPNEDEDEKKIFTYDINAGSRAVLRIVQTEVNKLNDNLIKNIYFLDLYKNYFFHVIFSAISRAFSKAPNLLYTSSNSFFGFDFATIPAPA